jgi:hypothetical protein
VSASVNDGVHKGTAATGGRPAAGIEVLESLHNLVIFSHLLKSKQAFVAADSLSFFRLNHFFI